MEGRRVRFSLVISVSIIFLMAYNARSQSSTSAKKSAARKGAIPPKSATKNLSPAANAWVETTLRKMTVDEKIGQLLFTTYHGSLTATDTAAYRQIMHDVTDLHVGGFINITQGSPLGIVKSQAYPTAVLRSEEHTSELQSRLHLVCRLLLEKKKDKYTNTARSIIDEYITYACAY